MPPTSPPEFGDDRGSRDALWEALAPDAAGPGPAIRGVMIGSVDGTTTVDGRSGGLGTPTDRLVYHGMRARSDLVLVGAATALDEGYGRPVIAPEWREHRPGPPPQLLVLSRGLSDDLVDHVVPFADGVRVAVPASTDPDRVDAVRGRGLTVDRLEPGPLGGAVRALLHRLGAREVAFEGGPRLLGRLLADGAVDELVLSWAPEIIVGGDPARLVSADSLTDDTSTDGTSPTGPSTAPTRVPLRVAAAFTGPDGGLYTRWVVHRDAG